MSKVYLAGPFFNPAQVTHVSMVETIFREFGIPFFSPRIETNCGNLQDSKHRKETLKGNILAIQEASWILALLDWLLPEGQTCRIVSQNPVGLISHMTSSIHIPDSGTVWEMGLAFALQKPTIGFLMPDRVRSINLMLSDTMRGILVGYAALSNFLKNGQKFEELQPWQGGVI